MGGILARIGPGDSALAVADLQRMVAADPVRGPLRTFVYPGVALGLQAVGSEVTWSEHGDFVCLCNGFLMTLDGCSDFPPGGNPAEALLDTYVKTGWSFLDTVDGQFSALIYKVNTPEVWVIRDVHGLRPLLWQARDGVTWLASGARQVLAGSGAAPEPDAEVWFRQLALNHALQDEQRTFWKGVRRLAPASLSRIGGNGPESVRRFWTPPPEDRQLGSSREALLEVWGDALRNAVRRSLPTGRFAVAVSGGLDSTSVWAHCRELVEQQGRAEDLLGMSMVYPGWECDESELVDALQGRTGGRIVRIDGRAEGFASVFDELTGSVEYPVKRTGEHGLLWGRVCAERGIRHVLTGMGGDEYFTCHWSFLADLLYGGRFGEVLRWSRRYFRRHRELARRRRLRVWLRQAVLPPSVWLRRTRAGRLLFKAPALPVWVDSRWASLHRSLVETAAVHHARLGHGRRERVIALAMRRDGGLTELQDALVTQAGILLRHPLLSRALADLGFRTPPQCFCAGDLPKQILADLNRNRLPSQIVDRRVKSTFSCLEDRQERLGAPAAEDGPWRLVELGVLDERAILDGSTLPEHVVAADWFLRRTI
jgi:asparagine synthetase B (glutamine-hydrolysing)